MNVKILKNLFVIAIVAALAAGGTYAWVNDQQSSTGNTYSSGDITLKLSNNSTDWTDNVATTWNYTAMAPGGTPNVDKLYLKNVGLLASKKIGLSLANGNDGGTGFEKLVRITQMDLDGQSLLTGGAGAYFRGYEPENPCTATVTNGNSIQTAINAAASGATICVDAGTYSENLAINKELNVVGINPPDSSGKAVLNGTISITADGSSVQALYIEPGTVVHQGSAITISANNILVGANIINNVNSPDAGSVKGIYAGDSTGAGARSGLAIIDNRITNITESYGKGAYGILLNYGASSTGLVQNVVIQNNTIANINGGWAHAIGLETKTPDTLIKRNDIHDIVATGLDSVAVMVEDNPNGDSVSVTENNFGSNLRWAFVSKSTSSGVVYAQNNWWGDLDPSDQIAELGATFDASNFAGSGFAGFINGSDANGNGYADMEDFRLNPIVGLDFEMLTGEVKEFIMGVQLDGPATTNGYQGNSLVTDVVIDISQI
jgi:predicted ribosomally synthesized peptide with SipW-like signal peptide